MKPICLLLVVCVAVFAGCKPKPDSSAFDPGAWKQIKDDPSNALKTWTEADLFIDSLPIPRSLTGTRTHTVEIRAFKQLYHSHLDSTWVVGYVPADTKKGKETLPGPTIEATYGQESHVDWQNKLKETLLENEQYTFPNKWYPIVYNMSDTLLPIPSVIRSLYPDFRKYATGVMPDDMMEQSTYYATTVHLHGANLAWRNDGYPSAKLLTKKGTGKNGHKPEFKAITVGLFGPHEQTQQQSYTYPNTFPEGERTKNYADMGITSSAYTQDYIVKPQSEGHHGAILWYHDHAMMRTTTNVYTGLAGAYLIKGDGEASLVTGINQKGAVPDIPLLISDRSFTKSGRLFYEAWQNDTSGNGGQSEFFGNTITVNGKVWPYMNVDKGLYRFRLLNTSPYRFLKFALLRTHKGESITEADTVDRSVFIQIGTEGGLMPDSFPPITKHDPLVLAPGERADVLINFSNFQPGDSLVLVDYAPNGPYGNDDDARELGELTNQIMQFRVGSKERVILAEELKQVLATWTNSNAAKNMMANLDYYRKLSSKKLSKSDMKTILKNIGDTSGVKDHSGLATLLNDPGLDSVSRFEWTIVEAGNKSEFESMKQLKPFRKYLAATGMSADSLSFPMAFMEEGEWNAEAYGFNTVKNVKNLRTEIWEIRNRTEDVHPIHTHLNRFRILARQEIDSTGKEIPGASHFKLPERHEQGWKDVVRVKPGYEMYILVQHILNDAEADDGQFVYHCHILAHEDASMMRRMVVKGKHSAKKSGPDPALTAILSSIPLCGSILRPNP